MGEITERFMAEAHARMLLMAEGLAIEVANDMRRRISTPVVRRGRTVILRSKPGEPPRRETGTYLNSYRTNYGHVGSNVTYSEIYSQTPYAGFLNSGTAKMAPRPHGQPVFDSWKREAIDRFTKALIGPYGR